MGKLLYLILLVSVFKCNGYQPANRDFSVSPERHIHAALGFGQSILGSISQGFGVNFGQQYPNKPQGPPTHVEQQSNENNYYEHNWQKPPHGQGHYQGQHPHRPSYPERPNGNYGSEFGNQGQHGQGYPNNYGNNYHHHHHSHERPEHPHHHHHQGNYNNNGDFTTNSGHPDYHHQHQGHHNQGHNGNNQFNQNHPGRPTNQHHGSHNKPGNNNQFNQNNYPNNVNQGNLEQLISGEFNSGTHHPFGANPNKPSNGFPTNMSPSPFDGDKMTEAIPTFNALNPVETDKGTENKNPDKDDEDFEIDIRFKNE